MKICNKAKDIHGNSFTYTLITSDDITAIPVKPIINARTIR